MMETFTEYESLSQVIVLNVHHTCASILIHTCLQVELRRFREFGVMIIDDGIEFYNGSSPGTFTDLNINSGLLYLGGIPTVMSYVSLFQGAEMVRYLHLICTFSSTWLCMCN